MQMPWHDGIGRHIAEYPLPKTISPPADNPVVAHFLVAHRPADLSEEQMPAHRRQDCFPVSGAFTAGHGIVSVVPMVRLGLRQPFFAVCSTGPIAYGCCRCIGSSHSLIPFNRDAERR